MTLTEPHTSLDADARVIERSTVVRDTTIDPVKAGNETGEVRRGSRVVSLRVTIAIVDEPGDRP